MNNLLSRGGAAGTLAAHGPPCVLVVEDDAALRLTLARQLRGRGFEVYSAGSGAEAIEMYTRSGRRIDVVLIDVNMPGMSGPDTFDALREAEPLVRCCFTTADLQFGVREAFLACGALAVFDKPFASLADLCEVLQGHASTPTAGSGTWTEETCRWRS